MFQLFPVPKKKKPKQIYINTEKAVREDIARHRKREELANKMLAETIRYQKLYQQGRDSGQTKKRLEKLKAKYKSLAPQNSPELAVYRKSSENYYKLTAVKNAVAFQNELKKNILQSAVFAASVISVIFSNSLFFFTT